MVNIATS